MSIKFKFYLISFLLILNVIVWSVASRIEITNLKKLTHLQLESFESAIRNNLRENGLALVRMAERWSASGGTDEKMWRSDANSYAQHLIGVVGTGFADVQSKIIWIEPSSNNRAIGFVLNTEKERQAAIERAIKTKSPQATGPIQLRQGGSGFLLICPVHVNNRLDGFIYLVSRYEDYFRTFLTSEDFTVRVSDNGKQIFETQSDASKTDISFSSQNAISDSVKWRLTVSPSQEFTNTIIGKTRIPFTIMSSVFSLLLFFLIEAITKLRITSRYLRQQDSWLRSVADALPQLVWTCTPEGPCDYLNQQWQSYTGLPEKEQLGFGWLNQIHEEDRERVKKEWSDHVGEEKVFELNFRIRRYDGEFRWFHTKAIPIKDANNRLIRWLGSNTDIHDLLSAKAESEAASKAKAKFLATMSHEMRTPLNGIIGTSELLKGTQLNEEQKKYVTSLDHSGGVLLTLISDILDLSKIEAGQLVLENLNFNLEQAIDEVCSSLRFSALKKGVSFSFIYDKNQTNWLIGDVSRLKQVLFNLIGNAIKFTQEGYVEVSLKSLARTASQVSFELTVKDSGIGIAEENQKLLFSPFVQVHNSISRLFGGTGLGLAISKQIIEKMNGQIEVESSLGNGATFFIRLTLPTGQQPNLAPKSTSPAKKLEGTVLLVEDNPINQSVGIGMLTKLGLKHSVANNGLEALEFLAKTKYDVILMDCHMPELDGYETTRRIRSCEREFSSIPIIAMTANAMSDDRDECLAVGMNDYISKPVSLNKLSEVLSKWLPQ